MSRYSNSAQLPARFDKRAHAPDRWARLWFLLHIDPAPFSSTPPRAMEVGWPAEPRLACRERRPRRRTLVAPSPSATTIGTDGWEPCPEVLRPGRNNFRGARRRLFQQL